MTIDTGMRSMRLKVKQGSYNWLNAAAIEVNAVWNFANETSEKAALRSDRLRKRMSGFDLCALTAGASEYFDKIGSATIQRVCNEYATKRRSCKRTRLRWRVSHGSRRSLGWVPFKSAGLKRNGTRLSFCGKSFGVFESDRLDGIKLSDGCFAQDSFGDWWLCISIEILVQSCKPSDESVGIDLGLKTLAMTSDGKSLVTGRWTHSHAEKLANAQRRGHKKQAKRIHRKIARCRADALHKFSRSIVDRYQAIFVGDVSSSKLVKTRMAKSVLDAGWGMLKTQLQYKGQQAGRHVEVVNERNTTRACSSCGALTGPTGLDMLVVRQWTCSECGDTHDRDVNSARNIRTAGLRCRASICGNEPFAHRSAA